MNGIRLKPEQFLLEKPELGHAGTAVHPFLAVCRRWRNTDSRGGLQNQIILVFSRSSEDVRLAGPAGQSLGVQIAPAATLTWGGPVDV
jgi:hypothetical protein